MVNKEKLQRKREETKKEILEKLETCDRFAVVRPFGFGKTYTILELCKTLDGKKIILEPNLEILKNIKENIDERTECITYHTLLHKDFNPEKLLQYDYIFLDEIHRTLAPKWGKVLKDILEKFKGKVIGFTATPIRGDGRNPVDEIFNGEQITALSLVESIVEELLPNPTYVTGIYELNKIILNNKQLKVQLKNYDLQNSLNTMFNKYLDLTKTLKIMVFSYTVNDIKISEKYIEKWLNVKVNHYYYHSYQSEEQNKTELSKFKNATSGINVIHSVNQLNEGFHFDELDALIFLRKTHSDVVYLQQLGRGLSDNLHNIVVFDLMNNFLRNTNGYCKLIKEYAKQKNIKTEQIKTISGEALKIYYEQKDLIYLLRREQEKHNPLSKEEKQYILNNYKSMSCNQMATYLKRSIRTISSFLRENDLEYQKPKFLTKEEKQFILNNYKTMSYKQIAKKLQRSNTSSIINFLRKQKLIVSQKTLTEEEKDYIKNNCEKKGVTEIGKILNRDKKTISNYIQRNNLKHLNLSRIPLTKEEESFIKNNYNKMSIQKMKVTLKRDRSTIIKFLNENKLKYNHIPAAKTLSEEEKQYIIENYKKLSIKSISENLKRNSGTVSKFIKGGIKKC